MPGKHARDNDGSTIEEERPDSVPDLVMPDPDNLQVDVNALPLTGPITLPRREDLRRG